MSRAIFVLLHAATGSALKTADTIEKMNDLFDILNCQSTSVACLTLCQTTDLKNVIKGNTNLRNTGKFESTFDLVLTNSPNNISKVSFEKPIGATAHCRITVELKFVPKSSSTFTKVSWKYHLANWSAMCDKLRTCDWGNTNDVNQKWAIIWDNVKDARNSFIPKVTIKHKVDDQPWFTDKCAIACANKEKAWRAFRKDKNEQSKHIF